MVILAAGVLKLPRDRMSPPLRSPTSRRPRPAIPGSGSGSRPLELITPTLTSSSAAKVGCIPDGVGTAGKLWLPLRNMVEGRSVRCSCSGESAVRSITSGMSPFLERVPSLRESVGGDMRCEFVLLGLRPARLRGCGGGGFTTSTGDSGSSVRSIIAGEGCREPDDTDEACGDDRELLLWWW